VQHDQRIAVAGDFVVHLHAVDLDAMARWLGLGQGEASQQQRCGDEGRAEYEVSPFPSRAFFCANAEIERTTPP
jgi:hypothetical protein